MPSQDDIDETFTVSPSGQLFEAIKAKDLDQVRRVIKDNPTLDLNCIDNDELSPLQHACHTGNFELAKILVESGSNVNFTKRKDAYTSLMFAGISSRKDIVRLLLEHNVDTTAENCVNRTAAQMAAFVGQSKIVAMINSWVPFHASVSPYTKCRELEDEPRIPSIELGKLLHNYIVYPSLHPVKLLLFIRDNIDLLRYSKEFVYVLENLSSKSLKSPSFDECLSLKYHYLSYLIEHCFKAIKPKMKSDVSTEFDEQTAVKCMDVIIKRLIKRDSHDESRACTQQLDLFITNCLMRFPYTQLAIFKTMSFALTKRDPTEHTGLAILSQTLNGPRVFAQPVEACAVCGEMDKNKKCSKCKTIYYCSQTCQLADWFQHKKECQSPDTKPLLTKDNDPAE